jgi:hypothetical protein
MTDKEFNILSKEQNFIGSDFFDESFKFWFKDNEHIRTPFPENIQKKLKEKTFRIFMEWVYELTDKEKSDLENEEIAETFEMILFNQAMEMVEDNEQRITISYPFLPRPGDDVVDKEKGPSVVIAREMSVKEDEKKYLKLILENKTKSRWETEFELPA